MAVIIEYDDTVMVCDDGQILTLCLAQVQSDQIKSWGIFEMMAKRIPGDPWSHQFPENGQISPEVLL